MRLPEYAAREGRGVISRLVRESGLTYATVHAVAHGGVLKTYAAAKALSEATGGVVSIAELCELAQSEPAA